MLLNSWLMDAGWRMQQSPSTRWLPLNSPRMSFAWDCSRTYATIWYYLQVIHVQNHIKHTRMSQMRKVSLQETHEAAFIAQVQHIQCELFSRMPSKYRTTTHPGPERKCQINKTKQLKAITGTCGPSSQVVHSELKCLNSTFLPNKLSLCFQ